MLKKNLIGICVVLMMLGLFKYGYDLGLNAQGKTGKPGMSKGTRAGNTESQKTSGEQPSRQKAPDSIKRAETQQKSGPAKTKKKAISQIDPIQKKKPAGQVFYGTIIPFEEVNVQGEKGASITMMKYKEGGRVKKGEVLVKLDQQTKKLELLKARSAQKLSMQQVKQNNFNYTTELTKFKRSEGLYKENLLSNQEFDIIKNNLQSAASSYEIAKENLIQTETQISILLNELKDYDITSPISGMIDRKYYNQGEVYRSGDIIYHVINVEQVYAEIKIPETYLKDIREEMNVMVVINTLDDRKFPGTIETILYSDTDANRDFTTKVRLKNPDQVIRPGMFARIEIHDSIQK